ncbi:hypothetical protein JTE90_008366 [Oedothorax gibbosus]|uniref:Uncharacterized protein n=1 Tax=Oedothorax gibbosus TaxID=931172 RepID=A0AAV6TXA4_9ARAC|nr:hypothetical protein JTE90_008366 [Oedothorax gibbosus]
MDRRIRKGRSKKRGRRSISQRLRRKNEQQNAQRYMDLNIEASESTSELLDAGTPVDENNSGKQNETSPEPVEEMSPYYLSIQTPFQKKNFLQAELFVM